MIVTVSIIVPVYKAELFLERCVRSILRQTYGDWELILVDDGSPDDSGRLCDDFARDNARIKVIHKDNGGVSSARNMGLDIAAGKWICFVDADDYIDDNYLEVLSLAKSDLVILSSQNIGTDGILLEEYELLDKISSTDRSTFEAIISSHLGSTLFKTPWAKMFKKNCIGNLRFDKEVWIGEDTLFLYNYLCNINSIEIHQGYKYYWQTSDESSKQKYLLTPQQSVLILSKIFGAYKKLGIKSPVGEISMFSYYFRIMDKSKGYKHMKYWYNSTVVKALEPLIKQNSKKLDYLKYKLWKYPLLEKSFVTFLNFICHIKHTCLDK